jgi:hypothetical protein
MSCLFDSMHALLTKHGIHFRNSHVLRLKITAFMRDNPSYEINEQTIDWWIKQVSTDMRMDSGNYINRMSNASSWGGAMEISVMSKLFNVKIKVLGRSNTNHTVDCTDGQPDALFVLHWTGSHYTPVKIEDLSN